MGRPRRVTRQEQSDTTRRLLVEVSLELFVRRGYAGTTVRQIAAKAGISTGLMFHYFSSKQALLEEHTGVVEQGIHLVVDRLGSAEAPLATFKSIAEMVLHSFEDTYSRNLFLLANQVLSLDSIPATVKRRVSATKSIRASVPLIVKGQRKGEIRRGDPLALAVAYWGALQGIAEVLVWNPNAPVPEADPVVSILAARR